MTPTDKLIKAFQNDPRVIRFKALEKEIEKHPTLLQAYEDLKLAQQAFVRAKSKKNASKDALKAAYESQLAALKDNPFIEEYLDLIEELNYDLQWTIGEIEDRINAVLNPDFKP